MAGNGLSLKVLLELQKRGFEQGVASVKNSINGLRKTIVGLASTIIGGMGFSALVGNLKNTSKELSVVRATLENVSDSFAEYADSMEFIDRISKKYGQDMLELTRGFAKFHAAAKQTNLSMDQQKDIFEALTRAAGAYHLSAERTNLVMLAVEQMVSKGKVSAEELRRQLGENLPGAFNLMAKAAGVSTGELDRMLKAGQLISQEVLPKFAEQLNIATSVANFDSLQSSLNRFRNAWVDFVGETGFENVFKKFVDTGTKALEGLGHNFNTFKATLIGGVGGALGWLGVNGFKKLRETGEKSLTPLENYIIKLNKDVHNSATEFNNAAMELEKLSNVRPEQSYKVSVSKDDIKYLTFLTNEEKKRIKTLTDRNNLFNITLSKQKAEAFLWAKNDGEFRKMMKTQEEFNVVTKEQYNDAVKVNKVLRGTGTVLKGLWQTLKSIGINLAISAALTAIAALIAKLIQTQKEIKRIKNLVEDGIVGTEEKANKVIDEQLAKMEKNLLIARNTEITENERIKALNDINGLLGNTKLTLTDIETDSAAVTTELGKWKTKITESAKAAAYWDDLVKAQKHLFELERQRDKFKNSDRYKKAELKGYGIQFYRTAKQNKRLNDEISETQKLIDSYINKIENGLSNEDTSAFWGDPNAASTVEDAVQGIKSQIDTYNSSLDELQKKLKAGDISQKKYARDVRKLSEETMKNIQGYDKWEDALESLGSEYEAFYKKIEQGAEVNVGSGNKGSGKDNLLDAFKKYEEEKKKLDNKFRNGLIDARVAKENELKLIDSLEEIVYAQDDVEGSIGKLNEGYRNLWETIKAGKPAIQAQLGIFDSLDDEVDKLIDKLDKNSDRTAEYYAKLDMAKAKMPDAFEGPDGMFGFDPFDYKKSPLDKNKEYAQAIEAYAKAWKEYYDALQKIEEEYGDLGDAAEDAIEEAQANLSIALRSAHSATMTAQLSEIIEDLKELRQKVLSGYANNFNSIVGGFESIAGAIQSCSDAWDQLNEKDADGFDAIQAVLASVRVITTAFQEVNGVIKTFQETRDAVSNMIQANQRKEQLGELATAGAAALASEIKADGAKKSVAASAAEVAATEAVAAAESKSAVAKAAAAVAGSPFIGPALTIAAIGSVVAALIAGLSRFERGGIVGGSSTSGDKNVIRANKGEMILNKSQQGNLWRMINNGGGGGQVEFVIKGDALKGVLRNHDRRLNG